MDVDSFRQVGAMCFAPRELADAYIKAGSDLRMCLIQLYISGRLDAATLSAIAHYHLQSGGCGVDDYAIKPELASKHASEHVRHLLAKEIVDPDFHYVDTPINDKKTSVRRMDSIPMKLAHEEINDHVVTLPRPTGDDPLELMRLPRVRHNPAVQRAFDAGLHWHDVRPIVSYWDGVRYTTRESLEGFYILDVRSGRRYLCWLVRREDLCTCGCRGWCTLYPLLLA